MIKYWLTSPDYRAMSPNIRKAFLDKHIDHDYYLRRLAAIRKNSTSKAIAVIDRARLLRELQLITDIQLYQIEVENTPESKDLTISRLKLSTALGDLTEYERDIKIAELTSDAVLLPLEKARIDLSHGKMTMLEFKLFSVDFDGALSNDAKEEKKLALKKEFGSLSELEVQNEEATLRREPNISVSSTFNPKAGIHGLSFSFTWNQFWVKVLHEAGYRGTEEEMMDLWFLDVCRSAILADSFKSPDTPREIEANVVTDGTTRYIS